MCVKEKTKLKDYIRISHDLFFLNVNTIYKTKIEKNL